MWGCGIDIYLIILGVDFLDLRGGVVLWLRLVCPGRAFPGPWLHRLPEVFKILVSLVINSIVGLRLFTLFADGDGGDVRGEESDSSFRRFAGHSSLSLIP